MAFNNDELCYRNLKSYWQTLVGHSPDKVTYNDTHTVISTGIDNPLFNPIFIEQPVNLNAIRKQAAASGHSIWMPQVNDDGEYLMKDVPIMLYDLNQQISEKPINGVVIKQLEKGADLSEWIEPVAVSFELDEKAAFIYQQCLQANPQKFIHFIASIDKQVVGACTLFLADDSAGCYNLAVLPGMRNQGIASALHLVRLQCAKSLGYTSATLQATPMATHLDLSLGFKTQYKISIQA